MEAKHALGKDIQKKSADETRPEASIILGVFKKIYQHDQNQNRIQHQTEQFKVN
jgi:hypothetical protein